MYFLDRVEGISSPELRNELVRARVPGARQINVADALGKSGARVRVDHDGRVNRWSLTGSGKTYVTQLLNLEAAEPESVNATESLMALTKTISDEVIRSYIEEALMCFQVNAKRAAVVFVWTGA